MERQLPVLCPSAPCSDGALLLGIVLPNQTIAYVDRKLRLDAQQVKNLQATSGGAEKRFRFSSPCVQKGCQQWASGKCGVIEEVLSLDNDTGSISRLPACSIRAQCRWYLQRGVQACGASQYFVTDTAVMTEAEAAELVA
jgi:hypothetical protein